MQKRFSLKSFFYRLGGRYPVALSENSTSFIPVSRTEVNTETVEGQRKAYLYCDAVATVINRKATAAVNGKWYVADLSGKEIQGGKAADILKLLEKPNPVQDWIQFFSFAKVMNQIFGRAYIYVLTPVGMRNSVEGMYVIPNWYVTEVNNPVQGWENIGQYVTKYLVTMGGFNVNIDAADMMVWNDFNFDFSNETYDPWRGGSRLVGLRDPIQTLIASYEARNVLLTNTGAIGVLSNDSKDNISGYMPIKDDDKKKLQDDFVTKYGLQRGKWAVVVTNAAVKWQAMSRPTRDLMVFEEVEDDTRAICDAYGFPMYLLGFKSGTTFSNVNEAKKSLYENTIIPESDSFNRTFTAFFKLREKNMQLMCDYSHLPIMQEDEKYKAESAQILANTVKTMIESGVIDTVEGKEIIMQNTNLIVE